MPHVSHLHISNFRCFSNLAIALSSSPFEVQEPRGKTSVLEALFILYQVDPRYYLLSSLPHEGVPGPPSEDLWKYLFRKEGEDFTNEIVLSGEISGKSRTVVLRREPNSLTVTLNSTWQFKLELAPDRLVLELPPIPESAYRLPAAYVDEFSVLPIPAEIENLPKCVDFLRRVLKKDDIREDVVLSERTITIDSLPLSYHGSEISLFVRTVLAMEDAVDGVLLLDNISRMGCYFDLVLERSNEMNIQVVYTTKKVPGTGEKER